jgi:hypothetical protein
MKKRTRPLWSINNYVQKNQEEEEQKRDHHELQQRKGMRMKSRRQYKFTLFLNKNTSHYCILSSFVLLLLSLTYADETTVTAWKPIRKEPSDSDASLFQIASELQIIGPTHFPSPTRLLGDNVTVILMPSFGTHRSQNDAILAYAEGYTIQYYLMFMETLREVNYTGDVVLAIGHDSYLNEGVKDYLKTYSSDHIDEIASDRPNLVVYQLDLDCDGTLDNKRAIMERVKFTDAFQMCQLNRVYGRRNAIDDTIEPLDDPRQSRVVATLRYELYWIWSLQYSKHSWLMLLDARDSYFQSNPFVNLPRSTGDQGLLYFFGENSNATRIGKSKMNGRWIQKGYGEKIVKILQDRPTICSGSSMGEQVAVETYLRALILEHDEGSIRMTGSDQGFHNYIYYSGKLLNAATIARLVVWEQGRGIINNLGALRTDSLTNWGIRDPVTSKVYQWDGETLSPVVHQWDRDGGLHSYMMGRHREWIQWWSSSIQKPSQVEE